MISWIKNLFKTKIELKDKAPAKVEEPVAAPITETIVLSEKPKKVKRLKKLETASDAPAVPAKRGRKPKAQ